MNVKKWNKDSISHARRNRGLSQWELAEDLGCRQQTISEWETGYSVPSPAYQKLLELYFSQPFKGSDTPSNPPEDCY